jgi:AcrR family transcriptional regulator
MGQRGDQTRRAIIEAAAELFRGRAVELVSIQAIVDQAGVAKGTFYLYFDSKEDLVEELIRSAVEHPGNLLQELATLPAHISVIERMVGRLMAELAEHRPVLELMHSLRLMPFIKRHFPWQAEQRAWERALAEWLGRGVEQGQFAELDPDFAARFILHGAHTVLDQLLEKDREAWQGSLDSFGRELVRLIKRILGVSS